MHIRLPHIRQPRHRKQLLAVMLVIIAGLAIALPTRAVGEALANNIFLILSNIVMAMIKLFSSLTIVFISIMIAVARYNTFLNAPIVEQGWPIVRDLMNMVFIIALLIISAGTVLRLQNYRYNRLLGKLIIMAFLVNFSKFIAVFLLQFAQIVMLTFVNAFRDVAFGNFAHMFGMDAVLNFANKQNASAPIEEFGGLKVFVTLVAGLAMMLIAFVVTMSITVVLFVRIIALWLLIILSPLAYALRVIPNTEKYASQWWSEFGKYAVVGPVMAFFLWIALALVNSGSSCTTSDINQDCQSNPIAAADKSPDQSVVSSLKQAETDTEAARSDFISEALSVDRLITFVVGIIFLMMGLNYAQRSGGAGGAWAGKVATAGFGVAATVSGLNMIRDRTIAPVQGYLKERDRRRQAANARRTTGFTKLADQVESRTLGSLVERPLEATKRTIGGTVSSVGKSAWKGAVPTGKKFLSGIGSIKSPSAAGKAMNDVKDFVVKDVGGAIVGSAKTGGDAFKTGWRQGSEGERIRRAEIQKAKSSKDKFEQEIGRYGDMDPEARRRALEHGTASEKYAAALVAGRKNELNHENEKDVEVAAGLGKIFLDVANSAEELERSLAGFSPEMRQAMFGGMDVGAFKGGKRDMLAEIGFVKEAFTQKNIRQVPVHDTVKSAKFIQRNESQISEQMKKGFLSEASLKDKDVMTQVTALKRIDDDIVAEGTKNKRVAAAYVQGMKKVVDEANARGDYDEMNSEQARTDKKARQLFVVGGRGGDIDKVDANGKVVKDATGKTVKDANALDIAYNHKIKEAREQRDRAISTQGGNLTAFTIEGGKASTESKKAVVEKLNRRDLKKIHDKNPKTADDIMHIRRDWAVPNPDTKFGLSWPTPEQALASSKHVKQADDDDTLSSLGLT